MPRRVEITVAPDTAEELLAALAERDEVLSLTVERGAGLRPAGDAIRLIVPNRWLPELLRMLRERGIGRDEKSLLSTSETLSVVQAPSAPLLQRWKEVDANLNAEAGAHADVVGLITLAGALAALGLATKALHLVIAAMVVAPGFEPIARIGLALTTRGRTWRHGLAATALAYLALLISALVVALLLRALDTPVLGGRAELLASRLLVFGSKQLRVQRRRAAM